MQLAAPAAGNPVAVAKAVVASLAAAVKAAGVPLGAAAAVKAAAVAAREERSRRIQRQSNEITSHSPAIPPRSSNR